jgi:hypothetical protein
MNMHEVLHAKLYCYATRDHADAFRKLATEQLLRCLSTRLVDLESRVKLQAAGALRYCCCEIHVMLTFSPHT